MLSCEYVHMSINITDIHYRLYNRNRHEQTEVDRKLTNGASICSFAQKQNKTNMR